MVDYDNEDEVDPDVNEPDDDVNDVDDNDGEGENHC
jgi:hypothetical protein